MDISKKHKDPRNHILNVAQDCFCLQGFHGTSMRDIAIAAKVNSAMLNYYFGGKEELYLTLLRRFRSLSARVVIETNRMTSELSLFLHKSAENLVRYPKLGQIVMAEQLQPSFPGTKNIIEEIQKNYLEHFLKLLRYHHGYKRESEELIYYSVLGILKELARISLVKSNNPEMEPGLLAPANISKFIEEHFLK